uniref:Inositol oxygenase n=1 Tax=viral metagenome TaxID=1070528 RepID=A0A6C0C8W4_9ZZZZ
MRNYTDETKISQTYKLNHRNQTSDYVKSMLDIHCTRFDKCKMSINDILALQDKIIDESDPDLENAQIVHAYQTAERVRQQFPDQDYLHLVGLLHDCGKVLLLDEFGGLPQWSVVGDTFPVGCKHSDKIVYPEYFKDNPEHQKMLFGDYFPGCGIDHLLFSFSHDIYAYLVFKHNGCLIPEDGLKIIRYHSFYSWHNHGAYEHFMIDGDYKIRDMCQKFSLCDLYSKKDVPVNIDEVKTYYDGLIEKYFPKTILDW